MTRTWRSAPVLVIALAALLGACGEGTGATADDAATVQVADTDLGEILSDGDGQTLYVFDDDSDGTSSCYDACAEAWPPVATQGDPVAGDGVSADLLGTTERTDGTSQVTVDGRPVYLYASDAEPGDVTGQGAGGKWWVVSPSGAAMTEPTESETEKATRDRDDDDY